MAQLRLLTGSYARSPSSPAADFVERWDSEIRRIAHGHARRFDRGADMDDFAQAARIRLFRAAAKHRAAPAPYVRKIISNAVLAASLHRHTQNRDEPFTELIEETTAAEASDSDPRLKALVEEWMRGLSPRQRAVCQLIYFQDRTQAEAAAVLGVSQPRIAQLHRELLAQGLVHFSSNPAVA